MASAIEIYPQRMPHSDPVKNDSQIHFYEKAGCRRTALSPIPRQAAYPFSSRSAMSISTISGIVVVHKQKIYAVLIISEQY